MSILLDLEANIEATTLKEKIGLYFAAQYNQAKIMLFFLTGTPIFKQQT